MNKPTLENYRDDKVYPRVVRAVARILLRSDVVAPAEVLVEKGHLFRDHYDAWREGGAPYLERVIQGSLTKVSRILRLIAFHVHDLNMIPHQTVYYQLGTRHNRILRFSKSGLMLLEKAYSCHYQWNRSEGGKLEIIRNSLASSVG